MLDLFYLSHTAVPSHLAELEGLGLIEPQEQVLMALDGIVLDQTGHRVSGPTLHDYCLLTSSRVLLWARDYGRHLCYAFPLTELCLVEGIGLDPIHASLRLAFAAPGEEKQHFTFTLLPLVDLPASVSLLRLAANAAQELAAQRVSGEEASQEIIALLADHVFGPINAEEPSSPYRWPGQEVNTAQQVIPPIFQHSPNDLPPEQIYKAGRLGRVAWDVLYRTIRETESPFNLKASDLREVTNTLRALNDLLTTLGSNSTAREIALAYLGRRSGEGSDLRGGAGSSEERQAKATNPPPKAEFHEIPLRQRETPRSAPRSPTKAKASPPQHRENDEK